MIILMAFLVTLRPVPGQNIDYLAGRFVGAILFFAAIWAANSGDHPPAFPQKSNA